MSEMFFYGLVVGNLAGSTLVLIWIYIIHQNCFSSTATNTTCPVNFICPTMIFRTMNNLTDKNAQESCIKLVEKNKDLSKNARNNTKEKLKTNNGTNNAKDKINEVSEKTTEGFYEEIQNANEDENNLKEKKTKVSFVDTVDKIKDIKDLAKVMVDDIDEKNKGRNRGSRYKLFLIK